ncbi:MAG: hypothetical protein MHM6MM_005346 [Cercozoa sp. M6MM]
MGSGSVPGISPEVVAKFDKDIAAVKKRLGDRCILRDDYAICDVLPTDPEFRFGDTVETLSLVIQVRADGSFLTYCVNCGDFDVTLVTQVLRQAMARTRGTNRALAFVRFVENEMDSLLALAVEVEAARERKKVQEQQNRESKAHVDSTPSVSSVSEQTEEQSSTDASSESTPLSLAEEAALRVENERKLAEQTRKLGMGDWSNAEHQQLLSGLADLRKENLNSRDRFRRLSEYVPTKTPKQCLLYFRDYRERLRAGPEETPEEAKDDNADNAASEKTAEIESNLRGTELQLHELSLKGVDAADLTFASLQLRCATCRHLNTSTLQFHGTSRVCEKTSLCEQCQRPFAVRGTRHMLSAHATMRVPLTLHIDHCTPFDWLTAHWSVCCTCSNAQLVKSLLRETRRDNCRQCGDRWQLTMSEVKIVKISPSPRLLQDTVVRDLKRRVDLDNKPKRQALALESAILKPGHSLPDLGACKHARRSRRWFRFTRCCGRAFPCSQCHMDATPVDELCQEDESQRASRHICGRCCHEQSVSVGTCTQCGESLVDTRTTRYWEGGKGARDRSKMSKNERRKTAGLGKTVSKRKQQQQRK